jgi:general secretion pathway protein N
MRLRLREKKPARAATRWPGSAFAESTLAQAAWERTRRAAAYWVWAGLACGALLGLVTFAPAAWLADAVAVRTDHRLLLADARGTVWSGSAVPVLRGGANSHSAAMLPGRINWSIGVHGLGWVLRLRQPCCIGDEVVLNVRPGLGVLTLQLMPAAAGFGEWPAAWLSGLGAPWNTLQLAGTLRLSGPGMTMANSAGRWRFDGRIDLDLNDIASRLSTLERLGSYRLQIAGAAAPGGGTSIGLSTLDGALLLSGQGQWTGSQLRFRGTASAAPGFEDNLDNLLNIIGRRQGAQSVFSIG